MSKIYYTFIPIKHNFVAQINFNISPMILPIVPYGKTILRKKCAFITKDYPGFNQLIENMWETLENADGCGLAAPQINCEISLFIVNTVGTYLHLSSKEREEDFDGDTGIKETFINAQIISIDTEKSEAVEEGCLSIPSLSEPVKRPWSISIKYFDKDFNEYTKKFSGYTAKVIQHEYDHTQGKLYLDYLSPLRVELLRSKLKKIKDGKMSSKYPMLK